MAAKKRVGFIGVGLMGHGMAKNIVEKGYALTILGHRNRQPVEDLVGRGAVEAKNAAEVARRSDLVFLCVTGSPQVEAVVFGKDGLLEGLAATVQWYRDNAAWVEGVRSGAYREASNPVAASVSMSCTSTPSCP